MNGARALAGALEPFTGQVYFSPECHAGYEALGFNPSPAAPGGVALPDGPAYFTSRGSVMGQVAGSVVACAFGVFNPAVVEPAVAYGWSLTDAATICAARTDGATGQLARILGPNPDGLDRVLGLLRTANDGLRVEGKPLFAGLCAVPEPDDPLGAAWLLADRLREYRGDVHVNAWTLAGYDAVEIGLVTELYWGLPMGSYIRSRAWSDSDIDAAKDRLRSRGLIDGDGFTDAGRADREAVEVATDAACSPIVGGLGDDLDELVEHLGAWSLAVQAASGYPAQGPHDLAGG